MSLPRYSSAILPFAAGTICRARFTNGLVNNQCKWLLTTGRGVQRKISRRVKPLVSWVATCALLFSPCVPVRAELLKGDVEFSNYDAPLYKQIVNRIKAKVAARLGEGKNTQSEEHTSELQSHSDLVCRLLLEKKKTYILPANRLQQHDT